ncbi:hypothetical protein EDE12_12048 [Methylosinus sp. sav-2]|jgi:hypothetical protein|nr:hypothetical protein EDE12_12048 [Methylosinus sp. sav-2]
MKDFWTSTAELLLALPILAYLGVGATLSITQSARTFSPCSQVDSNIVTPDSDSPLVYVIKHGLMWPFAAYREIIREGMPVSHFIFASDCKWSKRPVYQRLFAEPAGGCPEGTTQYEGARCRLNERRSYRYAPRKPGQECPQGSAPVSGREDRCELPYALSNQDALSELAALAKPRFGSTAADVRPVLDVRTAWGEPRYLFPWLEINLSTPPTCPGPLWLEIPAAPGVVECVLPSLEKLADRPCPAGLKSYEVAPYSRVAKDGGRTEPKIEVCVKAD